MIQINRLFVKPEPSRDTKKIYILSEGRIREPQYFNFFKKMDSRIQLIPIGAEQHDDNSPSGLFKKGCSLLIKDEENLEPKYELRDIDEVWFVIDTDTWANKINELRTNCCQYNNWYVVQSNPCFEVWLYFHINEDIPDLVDIDNSQSWKRYLNELVPGGFDSRRHPIFIDSAIRNAKKAFKTNALNVEAGCTEVYKLAESFLPLIVSKIEQLRKKYNL